LVRDGRYGINIGLDSDNVFRVGGWSDGATYRFQADTAGNFTARGAVSAAGASGFASSTYAQNARNPIWRFGNADAYGLSYFQGTSGYGGTDSIGIHFGAATGGGSTFVFQQSGNFVATANITAYSDERVKTNWRGLGENFIDRLAAVKHGVYDRTDADITQVGVSAQSLREVMPEAVLEGQDGQLSVAYGNAALAAVIELAAEVKALRAEIAELKRAA
jgi:hypothetical protein